MKVSFIDGTTFESFYQWTLIDKKIAKKIAELIRDIQRNPTGGIGKPEPLKENLAGYYSRRINKEHRLVYKIEGDTIIIVSCKDHYEN